jgi:hypothetical protein
VTRIDTDGPGARGEGLGRPREFIHSSGNGSSAGTLAFGDLPFLEGSKSGSDHSSLDINMYRLGVSVGRDAAGVMRMHMV